MYMLKYVKTRFFHAYHVNSIVYIISIITIEKYKIMFFDFHYGQETPSEKARF